MKLKFELNGYEIVIEETEGGAISVSALKDEEIVEEFELEGGEDLDGEDLDDGENHDELDELPEGDLQDDDSQDFEGQEDFEPQAQLGESKLESFASFLKRK